MGTQKNIGKEGQFVTRLKELSGTNWGSLEKEQLVEKRGIIENVARVAFAESFPGKASPLILSSGDSLSVFPVFELGAKDLSFKRDLGLPRWMRMNVVICSDCCEHIIPSYPEFLKSLHGGVFLLDKGFCPFCGRIFVKQIFDNILSFLGSRARCDKRAKECPISALNYASSIYPNWKNPKSPLYFIADNFYFVSYVILSAE